MYTFLIRSENDSFVDVKKKNIWILIWSQSDRSKVGVGPPYVT